MVAPMGLAENLRKNADAIWQANLHHPFVGGIGDGSLPLRRFTFFLRQDYVFLTGYARALALASAKAPDMEGMIKFGELLHPTLSQEMALHRRYCAGFGISAKALERTPPAKATSAYISFLVSTAANGSIQEIAAALLPCQWGYSEAGLHLEKTGDLSAKNRYADWIRSYASPEFKATADWLRGYLNKQAKVMPPGKERRLQRIFDTSARHEYDFWEMAWKA
jgi:thiaminase/transcriptional activator TenA